MKKLLYSLIIMIAAICACQDENSELGKSLVDSSFYNIYVDTCTVDISTILMDSIETRGDSICQLGHYKDPSWGEASATYYAEYSTNSFTPNENYSYSFDSLVLRMTPSGHFWGDTLTQANGILSIPAETAYFIWMMTKIYTPPPRCPPRVLPCSAYLHSTAPDKKENWRYVCPTNWVKNC